MIPAAFDYLAPGSLADAMAVLTARGEDAKILAGGHSLLPLLKLRLASPKLLIDLSRIPELKGVREQDGKVVIGALTTHYQIESAALLKKRCPLLPETACQIGDVQVRNRGTIGGSLAHADPSAARSLGVRLTTLEEVLRESDFVSLHCRLTEQTRGLLGRKELALLRPTANTRITCWAGASERAEFLRQNALLANIWTGLGATTTTIIEPNKHHFDILDGLTDATHPLTRTLLST